MVTRERVREWLERHFFLRIHMSLILGATFGCGLLATKVLLAVGVNRLAVRYALAVFAAYLTFLLLIRIWLFYVRMSRGGYDFTADGLDFGRGAASEVSELAGGGGRFGGGGASGSWGKGSASTGKSSGFSLDGGDDGILVVLFVLLVLSLVVIGIYIIYTAPAMLSEAAFEAALAAGLVKRARTIHRAGWVGVVWRATIWPFAVVLVLSVALGWMVQRRCPAAKKLQDVWTCRPVTSARS